jgi:intein/homing endonuclease
LIQTAATSGDSFRGEPFACVTGDTKVCICDDDDNIFYTSIERLIGKNLTGSQILTEEGFQDFDGFVNQGKRNDLHRLTLSNNETLKCTPDHELRMSTGEYIQLQNLSIGDVLYNGIEVLNIESLNEEEYVYDALNVSNTNSYITNGVVSHNCLIMDEFAAVDPPWKAEQF